MPRYEIKDRKKPKKKDKTLPIVKNIKEHRLMEQQHAYQRSISYSQFSNYMACPHKWSLMYKDGHYVSSPSINMTFGTAIHDTIQHMLTILYEKTAKAVNDFDIESYFKEAFSKAYKTDYEKNNKVHFSNPAEMSEFFDDGLNILFQLRARKGSYFSKKGWSLVGIEIPILVAPFKYKNILFKGFIDMALYHEPTDHFILFDFKTSGYGWGDKEKKDEVKTAQLLLYKHFFAKQFNIPIENIELEYFILRRKIPEDNIYYIKHISQYKPIAGKTKMKKALSMIETFVEECFNDSGHLDKKHEATPDKYTCRFCPFLNNKALCSKGIE